MNSSRLPCASLRAWHLSDALSDALLHGTSIGGARPKALLVDRQISVDGNVAERQMVAKFSLRQRPVPSSEGPRLSR